MSYVNVRTSVRFQQPFLIGLIMNYAVISLSPLSVYRWYPVPD